MSMLMSAASNVIGENGIDTMPSCDSSYGGSVGSHASSPKASEVTSKIKGVIDLIVLTSCIRIIIIWACDIAYSVSGTGTAGQRREVLEYKNLHVEYLMCL